MSEEAKEKGNSKSAHRKKKGKKVTPAKYSESELLLEISKL